MFPELSTATSVGFLTLLELALMTLLLRSHAILPELSSIINILAGTSEVPVPGGGDLENELLEKRNINKNKVTIFRSRLHYKKIGDFFREERTEQSIGYLFYFSWLGTCAFHIWTIR